MNITHLILDLTRTTANGPVGNSFSSGDNSDHTLGERALLALTWHLLRTEGSNWRSDRVIVSRQIIQLKYGKASDVGNDLNVEQVTDALRSEVLVNKHPQLAGAL